MSAMKDRFGETDRTFLDNTKYELLKSLDELESRYEGVRPKTKIIRLFIYDYLN